MQNYLVTEEFFYLNEPNGFNPIGANASHSFFFFCLSFVFLKSLKYFPPNSNFLSEMHFPFPE